MQEYIKTRHFLSLFCLIPTCKYTQKKNLSCLCCCLNTKSLWIPSPGSKPPAVSQGGETQTRAQRALSTPQPLNTSSALPFENKPRRQAPVSNSRLICEHTCPTLRWELFGDFPAAVPGSRCENGAIRHDALLGNVETITLTVKIRRRGERWCILLPIVG